MKIKELKDLKNKELKDLEKMAAKIRLDLVQNQVKIAGGKEKNTKIVWKLKKELAQVLSIIKQ